MTAMTSEPIPAPAPLPMPPAVGHRFDPFLVLTSRWRSLLGVATVAVVGMYGITWSMTPLFQSTVVFLPPQQQSNLASQFASLGALASLAGGAGVSVRSPIDQYVAILQGPTVSDRVIDRFHLMDEYHVKYRVKARKALSTHVSVVAGKKDGLISVSVYDPSPQRAADIANHYVDELRIVTSTLAITEAQQRRKFFEQQLSATKDRLVAAQIALQSSGFNEGALKSEPKATADTYSRLHAELTAAQVKLETMRSSLADSSPEVRQQSSLVQALEQQLAKMQASDKDAAASGNPDYVGKYREFKYQEMLFDLFAKQFELAKVDESREGALIQVVDPALPSELKAKPQRVVVAVAAGFLITMLYAAGLLARAFLKHRSQDPEFAARMAALRESLSGR